MYGLIFFIFAAIIRLGANIILSGQDVIAREEARKKGKDIYTDHNGASRMTSNGQRFSAGEQPNGHWVWTNDKMQIVRDLSQESIDRERKESYEFAIKHGCSTYLWMSPSWGRRTSDAYGKTYKEFAGLFKDPNEVKRKYLPCLYKDIKTGEIYVVKRIQSDWFEVVNEIIGSNFHNEILKFKCEYFVNPKTNEIIRLVDDICFPDFAKDNKSLSQEAINVLNEFAIKRNRTFFEPLTVPESDVYFRAKIKEKKNA